MKTRVMAILTWSRICLAAAAGLVVTQLLMLSEVTENAEVPTAGLIVVAMMLVSRSLAAGRIWLWAATSCAGLGIVVASNLNWPLETAPGQSWEALSIVAACLLPQILLLGWRSTPTIAITLLAAAVLFATSSLDFENYIDLDIGHASVAVLLATVMLATNASATRRFDHSNASQKRQPQNETNSLAGSGIESISGGDATARSASRDAVRDAVLPSVLSRQWRATAMLLVGITVSGAGLSTALASQLPTVRRWIASKLKLPTPRQSARRTAGLSTDGRIGSVSGQKRKNSLQPALKVYTERVPGYLKACAFRTFTGRRWQPERLGMTVLNNATLPGSPPRGGMFRLAEGDGLWRSMRVENQPGLERLVFTTVESAFLEGEGERIRLDRNGSIIESRVMESYVLHLTAEEQRPRSAPPESQRYYEPLAGLRPELLDLALEVAGDATTDRERVEAVITFLRGAFEYNLEPFRYPSNTDPISYFLLERRSGHCEFFATGAIALLRHLGVPCRYVIGFLTVELEDEYEDYWVARNQDAHAWVEVFDRERGRWVVADPTPGTGIDETTNAVSISSHAGGGGITERGGESWGAIWNRVRWFARRPVSWLFLIVALGGGVYAWRQSTWSIRDPIRAQRVWLERRLRRRGLLRQSSETLHQFSRRILQHAQGDSWLERAAQWQVDYATLRFAGRAPDSLTDPRQWPKK